MCRRYGQANDIKSGNVGYARHPHPLEMGVHRAQRVRRSDLSMGTVRVDDTVARSSTIDSLRFVMKLMGKLQAFNIDQVTGTQRFRLAWR